MVRTLGLRFAMYWIDIAVCVCVCVCVCVVWENLWDDSSHGHNYVKQRQ